MTSLPQTQGRAVGARHIGEHKAKLERHQHILDLFQGGMTPQQVADRLNHTVKHVRAVLRDMGAALKPLHTNLHENIWEMDEDKRREAFARRARQGARNTLRQRDVIDIQPSNAGGLSDNAPQWRRIVHEVASKHGVLEIDITSQRRTRAATAARYEAAERMRRETTMSLTQIGRRLGGRDHSTIVKGLEVYAHRMAAK